MRYSCFYLLTRGMHSVTERKVLEGQMARIPVCNEPQSTNHTHLIKENV